MKIMEFFYIGGLILLILLFLFLLERIDYADSTIIEFRNRIDYLEAFREEVIRDDKYHE